MAGLKVCALAILLAIWNEFEPATGGYLITTSRVYRTGSVQTLNIDLHGDSALWNITASLKNTRNNKIISQSTKLFRGDSKGTMEIQVPQSVGARYNVFNNVYLQVHGVAKGKPDFKKKQALTLEKQDNKLFIQTDKPIYKPGQTIRLRVIGTNPDLKPLLGKVKRLFISNPKGVRMMQWDDNEFQNGITSVEMVLSRHPVLGDWKIQASYEGQEVHKIVEVAKYVLPKFEVVIQPPAFIAVDSKVVSGFICARYTYDLVVFGRLRATFDLKGQQILTIDKKIQGCYGFSFTDKELGLASLKNSYSQEVLNITANVTEEATGITSSTSTVTKIERYRVHLNFNTGTPRYFKPGLPFYGKLRVTTPDGKPVNNEYITIAAHHENWKTIYKITFLAVNGIVNFKIPHIRLQAKKLYLKAKHSAGKGITHSRPHDFECLPWYSQSSSFLSLQKLSKPIQVGKSAKINFIFTWKDNENITNVVYQLMCGGNMVVTEEIRIPVRQIKPKVGSIEFQVTQAMVPSCRLLVYYVRKDGETVADNMVVEVEDKLENQVVVRFSDDVRRPGEPVQITMTATPGSTVALAGVDKSVRLLRQAQDLDSKQVTSVLSVNDVGPTDCYKRKKKCYKDEGYVDSSKAFYDAGLIYLSDSEIESRPCPTFPPPFFRFRFWRRRRSLRYPFPSHPDWKSSSFILPTSPRNVPETWLWFEQIISNNSNHKTITAKVPDTITSWHLSAFAMSSSSGMGVANPSTLTVFQPFFVSFTLPYSVIRGEEVSVVTTVFNYMAKCATINVRLTKTDHFQLSSPGDQKLCVCGNEAKSVKYVITPVQLGHIPLTVTVQNVAPSLCENPSDEASLGISDAVTQKLLVDPEGVRQEYTYNELICPRDRYHDEINLQLPKAVVPESAYATISVIGDIMGPSLTGLEGLLDLPVGCGEQNMVKFAPNIFIMQYLNRTHQSIDEIHEKAVGFLRTGYQQELTYKRKDGSYSCFGDRDKEGSLWLTAFVLRAFCQAREFIFIDEKEIKSIAKWIESKQLDTGCFQEQGELFRKELKGGVSTPVTLTAYVLISLLESGINPKNGLPIIRALDCITAQKGSVTDAYSNAIIAYALTLARHRDRGKFLARLTSQATIKDDQMYWETRQKPIARKPGEWTQPYQRSTSANIEMTSYALMAMIGDGTNSDILLNARPIVRWLSKQRNALGGFSSTQDTCVALQALSRYAEYFYGKQLIWMKIDVGSQRDQDFHHNFHINYGNTMVLQRVEVPPKLLPMKLPINAVGIGCALIQAHVSYNTLNVKDKPAFNLSTTLRRQNANTPIVLKSKAGEKLCQPLEMNICAQWLEDGISDMAIIDVKLVSGFLPDKESLERLTNRIDLGLKDFEIKKNKLVFYFDEIQNVCFSFGIHQTSVVKKTKPASVTVYEYYDTDKSATTEYDITKDLCEPKPVGISLDHCPLCSDKLNLNDIKSLLCQMNNAISLQTLKNGKRKLELFVTPKRTTSNMLFSIRHRRPIIVTQPKGCRCAAMDPGSNAFVLLKKKKIDKQLKTTLVLDEHAIVLDHKVVEASLLKNALAKCPAKIEIYSGL